MTIGLFRTAIEAAESCTSKVFVVTGGYSGIGIETVKALLVAGASKVIVGGRSEKKQKDFLDFVKSEDNGLNDTDERLDGSHTIDLGSLKSVKEFAEYVKSTYPSIDCIICNAGVMNTPCSVTSDGFEEQMGTNVIGHYLLCKILSSHTKRQVWVSSYGHTLKGGPRLDLEALQNFSAEGDDYDGWRAYQQSKLGNILLAKEFRRRVSKLETASLHPGTIYTPLYRETGIISALKLSMSMVPAIIRGDLTQVIPKSAAAGAATTVYCASMSSEDLVNGGYYSNCGVHRESEAAKNIEDATLLYDFCDKVTKSFQ